MLGGGLGSAYERSVSRTEFSGSPRGKKFEVKVKVKVKAGVEEGLFRDRTG